jgi:hypothetical protein
MFCYAVNDLEQCWALKNQFENKLSIAEMRLLRWMCGKTRHDWIIKDNIRES